MNSACILTATGEDWARCPSTLSTVNVVSFKAAVYESHKVSTIIHKLSASFSTIIYTNTRTTKIMIHSCYNSLNKINQMITTSSIEIVLFPKFNSDFIFIFFRKRLITISWKSCLLLFCLYVKGMPKVSTIVNLSHGELTRGQMLTCGLQLGELLSVFCQGKGPPKCFLS